MNVVEVLFPFEMQDIQAGYRIIDQKKGLKALAPGSNGDRRNRETARDKGQ
jgi:hypothetical protein